MTAQRSRRSRLANWFRARPRIVRGAVLALLAGISLVTGLSLGTWRSVCLDCPSVAQIYVWEPKQSTKIFDRDAKLIAELFEERRTPIEISTLPKHVPDAFIAVEDKRFYKHDGIDPRGIARAAITRRGGGSTITQQLARNMFTEGIGFERRGLAGVTRKLKEAKVAQQIEEVYSKEEILQAYINQVNYGHGWRGIETASQHYFGKPAIELNPAEAAMLAAAVNAPGRYSPFVNADATLRRRNLVLGLMEDQGFLTQEDATRWKEHALPTTRHGTEVGRIAPYFVEWVRTILDNRYGDALYNEGLRVYTSLDLEIQRFAQAAMDSGWSRIERTPGFRHPRYQQVMLERKRRESPESPYLQGLLIALDPATGEVRALVGGRDFADSKFNRATQALRQPGSTFKPIVYYTALNSGVPASQILYDAPQSIDMPDGTVYSPKNYDPDFRGPVTLRDALKFSINTVAVRLGQDVGLESIAQTAREFGIRTTVHPYPSMPIGANDVIPLQLAEAYTVLATNGRRAHARPILRVEDASGAVIWKPEPEIDQVANPAAVAITRDLLQTALNNGTGYTVRDPAQGALPYTVPAAGKTGTTNDATDVWFAGFTPNLLAVVWFGFDKPKRIMPNAAGGVLAAPVWGRFMRAVYGGGKPELPTPEPWAWPEGIVALSVDRETGRLANEYCPYNVVTEYFISGTEPSEACTPYRGGLFGAPPRMPGDTVRDTVTLRRRP
jgi:1A family penicillin-binding protein